MTSYTQYALPMRYNEVSRVQTMQVAVTAESARSDQLDLVLRSPSGTFVPLLTTARSASTNLRATFSDGVALATTAMRSTAALTDTHELVRPDGVLSTIAGEPVAGQWTLYACDRVDDANEVTITAVALQVTTAVQATADQRPWSFELQGTAGQDNQRRNLLIWAVDAVGNTSESQTIALDIDTVSPALTVDQLATELLPGNPTVLFSGEVSDGSAVTSLVADIYTSAGFLQSVNLTPPADPPTGLREAYLFGRSSRAFRWTMPYTAIGLAAGTYTVQFAAVDSLGNRTQTDGYPFTIDAMTVPSSSVAVRQQAPIDQLQLRYAVDTGRDITEVYTTIGDDLHTTTAITDTAMTVYGLSGSRDDTLQVTMTNVISDTALKQVVVDDHALVGLTTDGYVVAQSVGTSTGFDLTTTISRTVQIALAGDDHLLTLSDTGVISDHSATGVSTFVTAAPAAAIAASRTHALAVLTNGDTIAWGMNTHGETTIPAAAQTDVAYLGAGDGFSVALTERGSVVAWGDNTLGQTTLPISATTGITSIAVGRAHAVALTVDGEVVAWGADNATQSTVPISATHAIAVFAGADSSAALTRDGTLITWGAQRQPADCCVGTAVVAFNRTHAFVHTRETRATQSVILPAGTQPRQQVATFYGVIPGRRYRYSITVRNSRGSSTVTGYVQAAVLYNKLFLPMVQPGAVVPTGAGR
jgi:hypothetical protein